MTKIEGGVWNRAKIWQDHCFIDQGDSNEWAGNNFQHIQFDDSSTFRFFLAYL